VVKKYPCKTVDMTFFDTAPFRYVADVVIKSGAADVFACFENAEDWPRWVKLIKAVEWTAEQPFGIGTTRTVTTLGGLVVYEEFIAWERGREMAFCFTHASKGRIESFAERYQIEEIDDTSCKVKLTMAMRPRGVSRYFLPLVSPVMRVALTLMLRKLACLLEGRSKSKSVAK